MGHIWASDVVDVQDSSARLRFWTKSRGTVAMSTYPIRIVPEVSDILEDLGCRAGDDDARQI